MRQTSPHHAVTSPGASPVTLGSLTLASLTLACLTLAGCAITSTTPSSLPLSTASLHGQVRGGQQPISNATIQLYAASTSADGAPSTPLLTQTVTTDANGNFDISHLYACPSPGSLVYLVATGGNPGFTAPTNNRAAANMTALGACGNLPSIPFVVLNEVTTVAAVFSLAPFMTSYAALGSGTADQPQLALAFAQAGHLVDIAHGLAPGPGLPSGFAPPITAIDSLANILSACVNTAGGIAGDGSACGLLFSTAKPASSPAATDTIGAALQIATHPSSSVAALMNLAPPDAPFQPSLATPPTAFSVAIVPSLFELYIDAASLRSPIDPNIYGIVNYGLDPAFASEIKVPNIRWGGDGTTRYNWLVDSSNAGDDWYFMSGGANPPVIPGASADQMINTYRPAGAAALITIPIIPYINNASAWNCSFPVSVYGAQQYTNPYVHPNGDSCGNSITGPNNPLGPPGTQIADTTILANNIANSPGFQQAWLQHLVATFGTAASGGVPFYQLDNEPFGWSNTHRDVEPTQPPYTTIVSLGQQYAAMVKQVDPSAKVLGPSDFTLGGWIGNPGLQNNLLAGQFYLQQMASYDQTHGGRILDYFDEHYYFNFSNPASQLASTRTLWDPTYNGGTWVEQYFFYGPMQLVPRFHQWIAQYDPGTKLAFSEYSIDSGNKLITDALAQADVLGIFGQQHVDFANMWIPPAPSDPIAFAFRLFRNYDGAGSQFGSTLIQSATTDPTQLAVYSAQRPDGALTLIVLNKTTAAIPSTFALANFLPSSSAAVYTYSNADLTHILPQAAVPIVSNTLSYTFPAYSATVLVLPGALLQTSPL